MYTRTNGTDNTQTDIVKIGITWIGMYYSEIDDWVSQQLRSDDGVGRCEPRSRSYHHRPASTVVGIWQLGSG